MQMNTMKERKTTQYNTQINQTMKQIREIKNLIH